jgi:tetratricopeptide (TPR) repeat protein
MRALLLCCLLLAVIGDTLVQRLQEVSPGERERAHSHARQGQVLMQAPGTTAEAVRHLRAAVEYDPTDPALMTELGQSLMKVGQWQSAVECFQTVLVQQPFGKGNRKRLLKAINRHRGAAYTQKHLSKGLEYWKGNVFAADATSLRTVGKALAQVGDRQAEAAIWFWAVLLARPNQVYGYCLMAVLLKQLVPFVDPTTDMWAFSLFEHVQDWQAVAEDKPDIRLDDAVDIYQGNAGIQQWLSSTVASLPQEQLDGVRRRVRERRFPEMKVLLRDSFSAGSAAEGNATDRLLHAGYRDYLEARILASVGLRKEGLVYVDRALLASPSFAQYLELKARLLVDINELDDIYEGSDSTQDNLNNNLNIDIERVQCEEHAVRVHARRQLAEQLLIHACGNSESQHPGSLSACERALEIQASSVPSKQCSAKGHDMVADDAVHAICSRAGGANTPDGPSCVEGARLNSESKHFSNMLVTGVPELFRVSRGNHDVGGRLVVVDGDAASLAATAANFGEGGRYDFGHSKDADEASEDPATAWADAVDEYEAQHALHTQQGPGKHLAHGQFVVVVLDAHINLGNRLIVLVSAFVLALLTNRALLVYWSNYAQPLESLLRLPPRLVWSYLQVGRFVIASIVFHHVLFCRS